MPARFSEDRAAHDRAQADPKGGSGLRPYLCIDINIRCVLKIKLGLVICLDTRIRNGGGGGCAWSYARSLYNVRLFKKTGCDSYTVLVRWGGKVGVRSCGATSYSHLLLLILTNVPLWDKKTFNIGGCHYATKRWRQRLEDRP